MAFYPLVDDDCLLHSLDGWMLHTVYTSLRERASMLALAGHSTCRYHTVYRKRIYPASAPRVARGRLLTFGCPASSESESFSGTPRKSMAQTPLDIGNQINTTLATEVEPTKFVCPAIVHA
jgi:hypothetical protein